jgi:hypothetical protein
MAATGSMLDWIWMRLMVSRILNHLTIQSTVHTGLEPEDLKIGDTWGSSVKSRKNGFSETSRPAAPNRHPCHCSYSIIINSPSQPQSARVREEWKRKRAPTARPEEEEDG